MNELKTFTVFRRADKGGVSGSGRILDGVVFHNGWVVVCWRTDIDGSKHGHSNVGVYPSWESFHYIHIEAHPENGSVVAFGHDSKLAAKLAEALNVGPRPPTKIAAAGVRRRRRSGRIN